MGMIRVVLLQLNYIERESDINSLYSTLYCLQFSDIFIYIYICVHLSIVVCFDVVFTKFKQKFLIYFCVLIVSL